MPKTSTPNLTVETTRHSKKVYYYRKGNGPRIRINFPYDTPEFWAEYQRLHGGGAPLPTDPGGPAKDTLRWLITRYKGSPAWANLAQSTRNCRQSFYSHVCKTSGDYPYAEITSEHIELGVMDRINRGQSFAANNFLTAMTSLFEWARKSRLVDQNPCLGIDRLKIGSDGHHTWSEAELQQFRDAHPVGTKARLAFEILYHTGLRRGDAALLGPRHVDGDTIEFKTTKNGEIIYADMVPELRAALHAVATGSETFLTTDRKKPFASPQSFGNWFAERIDEAGLSKRCVTHGIRKSSATAAANEEADVLELMAKYGWRTMSMAKKYTDQRDRKRAALRASKRLSKGGAVVVPFPVDPVREKGAGEKTPHLRRVRE
jgi:site-specific recombinase XerD